MKNKLQYVILLLCIPIALTAQTNSRHKTFAEIKAEKEAYFAKQGQEKGKKYMEEESSEYHEYKRWLRYWEPRLAPNGTFEGYIKIMQNNPEISPINEKNARLMGNTDPWKELGPFDKPTSGLTGVGGGDIGIGPIQVITMYRPNPNYMLAASFAGGLYYSSNKGVSWTNAGSDKWYRSGCSSMAFSPNSSSTWYACSNSGGDNNRGAAGSNKLWILNGGVYRTINAGVSYELIGDASDFSGAATRITKILVDPVSANLGYVATNVGLYKCSNMTATDSSVSWTLVCPGYIEDVEIKAGTGNNATLFISVLNSGTWSVKISNDYGVTWNSPSAQPTGSIKSITIEVTENNPNLIYLLYRNTTSPIVTLQTFNGINTFTVKNTTINDPVGGGHGFTISNFNANTVYFSNGIKFSRSIDGGSTFITISTSSPTPYHVDVEDIVTAPTTCPSCSTDVWIGTHGGVSFSPDNCSTIQSRSTGLGVAEIMGFSAAAINPEKIALGLNHEGTIISNGIHSNTWNPVWQQVYDGDGFYPPIDYSNSNYVWATAQYSTYRLSQTGGNANTFNSTVFPFHNSFLNNMTQNKVIPNYVYVKGANNSGASLFENLYRSNDRGISNIEQISDFQNINGCQNDLYIYRMTSSPSDPNFFYLKAESQGGSNNRVYLFRTNQIMAASVATVKNSWISLTLPLTPQTQYFTNITVDNNNPNIVYITYSGYWGNSQQIWRADYTNVGTPVFTDLSGNLPLSFIDELVLEKGSNGGIYISTDIGVYYTNNEYLQTPSTAWRKLGNNLPRISMRGLEINYKVNKIRVATGGRGVWEHDLWCPGQNLLAFNGLFTTAPNYFEAVDITAQHSGVAGNHAITFRATNSISLNVGFDASATTNSGLFDAYIHGCSTPGNSFKLSNDDEDAGISMNTEEKDNTIKNSIQVYPNPNNGWFTLKTENRNVKNVYVYDGLGKVVFEKTNTTDQQFDINISRHPKGLYVARVTDETGVKTVKVINK